MAIRLSVELTAAIDAWKAKRPDFRSRSDAIRALIELGMKASTAPSKKRRP